MNRYTPTLIFLFLCLIFVFAIMACTNIRIDRSNQKGFPNKKRQLKKGRPIVRVPTKITSYPLRDSKGKMHKYTDNFDSFIFPQDNRKLTQYCAFHHEWENIKAVYKKDENGEWKYSYVVTKNKKSWK